MLEPIVFAVDDDASLLRGLTRLLRSHGFRVQSYESAAPFLEAIQPATPGCVLLDLSLPEISGLELQQRLLATGHHQPVVFLTGQGNVQSSVRALKAGALDLSRSHSKRTCSSRLSSAPSRRTERRAPGKTKTGWWRNGSPL